jgi:hypothetical protein
MSDPANNARLRREESDRQQSFRDQSARIDANIRREAEAAAVANAQIARMRADDARAARSYPLIYEPGSRAGGPPIYPLGSGAGGTASSYRSESLVAGFGTALGRVIQTLFVIGALYGAYDSVANQSSIGESAEKTGQTIYSLSNALGNKIRSVDPDSRFITIADDFRWMVGITVSINVGLGAGAGNAAVWVIRQGAHLIQSMRSTSSNAAPVPGRVD